MYSICWVFGCCLCVYCAIAWYFCLAQHFNWKGKKTVFFVWKMWCPAFIEIVFRFYLFSLARLATFHSLESLELTFNFIISLSHNRFVWDIIFFSLLFGLHSFFAFNWYRSGNAVPNILQTNKKAKKKTFFYLKPKIIQLSMNRNKRLTKKPQEKSIIDRYMMVVGILLCSSSSHTFRCTFRILLWRSHHVQFRNKSQREKRIIVLLFS